MHPCTRRRSDARARMQGSCQGVYQRTSVLVHSRSYPSYEHMFSISVAGCTYVQCIFMHLTMCIDLCYDGRSTTRGSEVVIVYLDNPKYISFSNLKMQNVQKLALSAPGRTA